MDIKKNRFNRLLLSFILMIPFFLLYLLSETLCKDVYLFEWMRQEHVYFYMAIVVGAISAFGKKYLSFSMIIGYLLGIIIGQTLGDILHSLNMKKITDNMSPDEKYCLMTHYGFFIWAFVFISFIVVGVVVQIRKSNSDK